MLQISQTEKPICSATIDQIKLRRAMNLPLEFQNLSSSGFQSEIQVVVRSLIGRFPLVRMIATSAPARSLWPKKNRSPKERSALPPDSGVACWPVVGPFRRHPRGTASLRSYPFKLRASSHYVLKMTY